MSTLAEQLAEVEAAAESLRRQIAQGRCADTGHQWDFLGGANAGCCDTCNCSRPVYRCLKCGDCDYGDNEEGAEVLAECAEREALAEATPDKCNSHKEAP